MRFSIKVCVLSGQLKFSEVDDVKLLVAKRQLKKSVK